MGKLRKIGKKLKKGLGKLMGSKLGKIVGMIGLAMSMGSLAGAFIGGTKQVAGEAALKEVGKEAIKEVGKETVTETGKKAIIKEITVDAVKRDSLEVLADATLSNSEAATAVLDSAENMVKDGLGTNNINTSLTESVNQLETDLINYEQIGKDVGGIGDTRTLLADASGSGNAPTSDFYSYSADSLKPNEYASDFKISEAGDLSVGIETNPVKGSLPTIQPNASSVASEPLATSIAAPTADINPNSLLVDTASSINQIQPPNAVAGNQTFLQKVGTSVRDLPQNTVDFVKDIPENTKEFFKQEGSEIASDVAKGAVTGYAGSLLMGDPEETTYSRGVISMPSSEGPIDAYMKEIEDPYKRNTNVNVMPTYEKLQKELLYGTGAPDFVSRIELPQINVGIPRVGLS